MKADVAVIGGGLAGLSAALSAQRNGAGTTLVSSGMGVLYLSSGNIHLMAYPNGEGQSPALSPLEAIANLRDANLDHPYSKMNEWELCRALDQFITSCGNQELHLLGDGRKNWRLLTALGTGNPCGIAQTTMVHGDLNDPRPMALIGFEGFREFYPELVVQRIQASTDIEVRSLSFDPKQSLKVGVVNTVNLGRAFEDGAICEDFAEFINRNTYLEERVGIPAVLGVDGADQAFRAIEEMTGRALFEISILPPSLPGRRIYQALKREFFEHGGQMVNGCPVLNAEIKNGRVVSLTYRAGEQKRTLFAGSFILATGSFFSGGLLCEKNGLREPVFHLPVDFAPEKRDRFQPRFLAPEGHPLGKAGIRVNGNFSPCDPGGDPIFENLFVCGDCLGGFDSLLERSGGGVAIASGTLAGRNGAKAAI